MTQVKSVLATLNQKQIEKFDLFAKILLQENEHLNLTRITDPDEIRLRHFEDSLVVLPLLNQLQSESDRLMSLIDVGSGGGFPGLALAIALPDWRIVSLEATGKKADFQELVVEELGLRNVEVYNERAEEMAKEDDFRERFDVGTARAVGHLSIIAELTMPFIRKGGTFLSWKGPKLDEEMAAGKEACKILGGRKFEQIRYALPGEDMQTSGYRIFEVFKEAKCPSTYPREYKAIKASPLGTAKSRS